MINISLVNILCANNISIHSVESMAPKACDNVSPVFFCLLFFVFFYFFAIFFTLLCVVYVCFCFECPKNKTVNIYVCVMSFLFTLSFGMVSMFDVKSFCLSNKLIQLVLIFFAIKSIAVLPSYFHIF